MPKPNAETVRRLTVLADFLAKLPDKCAAFDMGEWARHEGDGAPHLTRAGRPGCGTSACALGWAASLPEFKRLGLGLTRGNRPGMWIPTFGESEGNDAGREFFGIKSREADLLFLSGMNATPREKAEQLREVAESYRPTPKRAARGKRA